MKIIFHFCLLPVLIFSLQMQEPIRHDVFVGVKLIEIYVIDKSGNPVTDLQAEDIEVFSDGISQPLVYFEKKEMVFPFEKKQEELTERKKGTGRKIFFFFDFSNNTKDGVERAKEAAIHFIDNQVDRTDLLGVISYSIMGGLRCHEYLTHDRERIKQIIKEVGSREVIGQMGRLENFFRDEHQVDLGLGPNQAGGKFSGGKFENLLPDLSRTEKMATELQIREFCSALVKLAKALRYISGNKHIILFSTGAPDSLIYGIKKFEPRFSEWGSEFNIGNIVLREKYEEMAKEFTSSNCLIYTLNTEGIPTSRTLASGFAESGEHSLLRLSQITGGKYYPNTEDLRPAVEDIAKRTSFYYVIGIPVKEEMDGKFHRIEVKVRRKGVRVHAPSGYYNPKPFKEYTEFEKFLHLVDTALSEKPLFGEVKEFPLSLNLIDRDKNIFELSFDILKEDYKGEEGEVFTIFFDSKKEIIKVRRERFRLGEDAESFSYKRVIEIPSEAEEIRVVIRDLQSGKAMRGVVKLRL